jgi:RecB family exonuclease
VILTVLLVPSRAAAVEIPRRLAGGGRALAGLRPMKVMDLAEAIAQPVLLGRGLRPWDSGHGALIAARLLDAERPSILPEDLPRPPIARVLARTFSELRLAGVDPGALASVADNAADDDQARLRWVAALYRAFHAEVEGRFADPATSLRAAAEAVRSCAWLREAEILVADGLEPAPLEQAFLNALARERPWRRVEETPGELAALFATKSPALAGLPRRLFEPPDGERLPPGDVELVAGPGEAAEARSIARRILSAAAAGMPFEDMAVLMPRPDEYARLFADLFTRLAIPHRLHPSLPLRFGRTARSLLLLFRCRGLRRREVMEFLTFTSVPYRDILGALATPRPTQWDVLSREAGIVSGLDRWEAGTRAFARQQEEVAEVEADALRRDRYRQRAQDAGALFRVVSELHATLALLSGEASWAEWAERLLRVLDAWIVPGGADAADREAVRLVLQQLAALGAASAHARWPEVEAVLESRFEWQRQPLAPLETGGVHIGSLDALAGLPFRWVAIVGLVEGGFPGVLRPDPLLLDADRQALRVVPAAPVSRAAKPRGQLSLFDDAPAEPASTPAAVGGVLPTTQDRLIEARRTFVRAVAQATESLVLSYPRADARSGRERLPSLFFVAAATALRGRTVGAEELASMVSEDDLDRLPLETALEASERDRARVRTSGDEAVMAIAAGSRFFKQSHLASRARWSRELTPYDGLVAGPPVTPELAALLDPVRAPFPISASRLATYARCGFLYLLQHVLRLEAVEEPEERTRLDPLERGSLFHDVAERFLRERRDAGALPVRDTGDERARLREIGEERLQALVAGAPPRFTVLWERERERFHGALLDWLGREARSRDGVPAHFEVGFGLRRPGAAGEPHLAEPLSVDLGDGRTLRVSGKIDRIDRRPEGGLVIRDYKTGRAPKKDDVGLFRGGQQLQIPFYVLAAARLFPDESVRQAFLDYVDGGRRVEFDLETATGPAFQRTLQTLVNLIASGSFVQEPDACDWCDFKAACGPKGLIARRRSFKSADRRVVEYQRLRGIR